MFCINLGILGNIKKVQGHCKWCQEATAVYLTSWLHVGTRKAWLHPEVQIHVWLFPVQKTLTVHWQKNRILSWQDIQQHQQHKICIYLNFCSSVGCCWVWGAADTGSIPQEVFFSLSADFLIVFMQQLCAIACINICANVKKPNHKQPYYSVDPPPHTHT